MSQFLGFGKGHYLWCASAVCSAAAVERIAVDLHGRKLGGVSSNTEIWSTEYYGIASIKRVDCFAQVTIVLYQQKFLPGNASKCERN